MFAFGVWDRVEKKLFLARDRVGQKPLFYTLNNNVFGFSSEMKGLYGLLNRIKPNSLVLEKVLEPAKRGNDNGVFNYEYTSECIVYGINRLEAGSYLIYNLEDQSINKRNYWNLLEHKMDVPKSYKDQVHMFKV
jgi:asparagine synthase (glutamine-hydrolysing)